MSRAGYVLVGGKSSRMGRDKALLPLPEGALASRVARAVEAAAGSAVLVGNPERYRALGWPVIPDSIPDFGPVAGIHAALRHTAADWNLILACDLPGVSAVFLRQIIEAAETSYADCLIPTGPSGRPEPLCAVYHRRILPTLDSALAAGVRKIMRALEGTKIALHEVGDAAWFENLNTPEDWSTFERREGGGKSRG